MTSALLTYNSKNDSNNNFIFVNENKHLNLIS